MGYSAGTRIIKLVTKYLVEMSEADNNERIEWVTNDPTKLAFWLHNAIEASRKRVAEGGALACEPYLSYARLKSKYMIRKTSNSVIADPRDVTPLEAVRVSMSKMVIDEATEPIEVVGAAIKHKVAEMEFPNAHLNDESLALIYNWAHKNDYKVIVSDGPTRYLKLSKSAGENVAWTPLINSKGQTLESGNRNLSVKDESDPQESTLPTSQDMTSLLLGLTENGTTLPKDT